MKLTKSKLKQIIKEELRKVLQEKLTPAQRQADYDVAASYDLAGPLSPGGSNPTLYGIGRNLGDVGYAGEGRVAPEVFKRKSEGHARYLECSELTARRLKKLGFQWPKWGDTLADGRKAGEDFEGHYGSEEGVLQIRQHAPSPGRIIGLACEKAPYGCPGVGAFLHKSDDEAFLKCINNYIAMTWNPT